MIGVPSVSSAQDEELGIRPPNHHGAAHRRRTSRRRRRRRAYTPAPGAKDLKSVLFNWAWHMGMLRSTEEYDLLMSLMYQGTGTVQVGGQPCNVTMYRSDISYQTSGERIRITGTRPNGQSCNTIEVLSGAYTWNEDTHGRRARRGPRQSHADAGRRRGADDSPVGQPAGCVEGRDGRHSGHERTANGGETATRARRCVERCTKPRSHGRATSRW